MLFVLLSHFGFTYFSNRLDLVPSMMTFVGMVASPTFIIISGMLVGFLYRTRGSDFKRLQYIFLDRGVFLLTIGHVLILASQASYAVRFLSITDTVGVCMIVGPWLVTKTTPRTRLFAGFAICVLCWVVIENWHPHAELARVVKATLFGSVDPGPGFYVFSFPVLPWFSLDLAASALGDRLGVHCSNGDEGAMQRLLIRASALGLAAAATLNLLYHAAKHSGYATVLATTALASPFAKNPPSLVYFLFYGGLGLGLVATCLSLARGAHAPRLMNGLARLGQTSFALFVIQFFVYFTVLPLVRGHLPWAWAWGAYFLLSIVLVVLPGLAWHRLGCNRFLTVGIRQPSNDREAFWNVIALPMRALALSPRPAHDA